jgi:hypothetical protein
MSLRRSFTMMLVMVALPSLATRALARRANAVGPADDAQVRDLLAKLAAASGTPEPEERTDADLMYEAMLRWNGEPADSKTIDRVLDQSKRDAARSKRQMQDKVRHMFWKDPFADDPHKLILVRQEDRDLLDQYQRKTPRGAGRETRELREPREVRAPRDELARLRDEVSRLKAENARIRERADEISEPRSCVADTSTSDERRRRRHLEGSATHSHRVARPRTEIALASTAPVEPAFVPPPTAPSSPPPAHGMIIEPLPSPPAPPSVQSGRHHGIRSR